LYSAGAHGYADAPQEIYTKSMNSTKKIYNWVYWSLMIPCLALYFLLLARNILPQFWKEYSVIFLMLLVAPIISRISAAVCKSFGVSQEAVTIESYRRTGGGNPDMNSELKIPGDSWTTRASIGVAGVILCLVFGIGTVFWIINPADDKNMVGKWAAPLGLVFFGGILLLYFLLSKQDYQLTDEEGVHGCTLPFLRDKIVPWHDVQRMEIKTKRNPVGEVTSVTVVLRDVANVEQARVFLQSIPAEVRDRFLHVVIEKARLKRVA
jgi:hypothetical protein